MPTIKNFIRDYNPLEEDIVTGDMDSVIYADKCTPKSVVITPVENNLPQDTDFFDDI